MPPKEILAGQNATIVNAELSGLNADDLSQVAELLNTCMDAIESIVAYQGGKIVHFIGANFLAIFAGKKSEKENAIVALDALLEIQTKLNHFSDDLKTENPIGLSAGIATSEIVFGEAGLDKKRVTLLGEALEQALKIRQIANQGQVLTEKNTFSLCKGKFNFNRLEPIPFKGMDEPLQLFKLIEKKETKLTFNSEPGRLIQSKMVGREKEKELLLTAFNSLTEGEGGIVNIIGAPGTGKSRLIYEIKKESLIDKTRWFDGKCLSNGQGLSYHPFSGIIKSWAEIQEEDSPVIAEKKLKKKINSIYPDANEQVFPLIARFMGLSLTGKDNERIIEIEPESLDKMMLKAMKGLLIKASTARPFIICIEDLHWSDQSTLKMLRSLCNLSLQHAILFINIMRPSYDDTSDPFIKFLKENFADSLKTLELVNLNAHQSGELIRNLLLSGQLPESLIDEIISKTQGNPFFIEEVLRSLIDKGVIEFKDGSFELKPLLETISIPDTINEVLKTRVGNLDEKTRNLLDTASVIGRNFYFKVLDEAADTIGEVSERLQYLKNMQFIQETGDEENLEFVFKHALAHQAAYDSMMDKKRKSLHLKIAESIEKVFPERINEFYGTLAMHYNKAENYAKAGEYLMKAGNEAYLSAASAEAIDYFKEAFRIYLKNSGDEPDPEKLTIFYERIANAFQLGGKNGEAIEYYEKVLKHYGKMPPSSKIKMLATFFINIPILLIAAYFPRTRFKKQATELDKRLSNILFFYSKALYSHNSKRWFLNSLFMFKYISTFSFSSNEIVRPILAAYSIIFNWTGISLSFARKFLEISEKNLDKASQGVQFEHALYSKMHQFLEGNWKEDPRMEKLFESAMKRGDAFNLTPFLLFCGFITIDLGLEHETFEIIGKMKKVADEFENDHSAAQYYRLKAVADFKFRNLESTYQAASEGIEFTKKTGHQAMLQVIYSMRAMSAIMLDNLDGAKADLREVEKLMPQQKRVKIWYSTYFLTKACVLTEELRRNPEDKDLKNQLLKTCRSAIKQSAMVPNNLIESHRISANAMWMIGKKKKAIKHYLKSIEAAKKVYGKLELSRTYFELGKRMLSNGSIPSVNKRSGNEYIEEAHQLFTAMNLTYDMAELERFLNK
jgi:class 3 adenylate cyclase/tetratricopeptide (TPR) repeat protein